jgi:acetylornithine deacetylase/succinyl-diaminopimelate desuccinylase-like protein
MCLRNQCDSNNPLLTQLAAATELVTGNQPAMIRKFGGSDARFYPGKAVTFGIAGGDMHGDGEYASLKSVAAYRKVLTEFMISVV